MLTREQIEEIQAESREKGISIKRVLDEDPYKKSPTDIKLMSVGLSLCQRMYLPACLRPYEFTEDKPWFNITVYQLKTLLKVPTLMAAIEKLQEIADERIWTFETLNMYFTKCRFYFS